MVQSTLFSMKYYGSFLLAILVMVATPCLSRAEENLKQEVTSQAQAIFAGGCFWCMQSVFDTLEGVINTQVGYSGGSAETANYKQVSAGGTGHLEVLQVTYDPAIVSYEQLLNAFWQNVDPLDSEGQFCDKGESYKSAIFYSNDKEKKLAEASLKALPFEQNDIATKILPAKAFYRAEDYHQDYYKTNPLKYKFYRWNCGRDQRLIELWQGS